MTDTTMASESAVETPTDTAPEATEGEALETVEEPTEDEAGAPTPRKYKVKVDGEELEVDEATLLRDYQLSKASHARMQEAARVRQDAEAQVAQIRALALQTKEDPRVLFKALGLDARKFAEALLTEELENELLSPEEKELRELRQWRQKQETEAQERQRLKEQEESEALAQQAGAEVESEIVDALTSAGIKPTPRTVARVAEMLLAGLEGEGPRPKATDILTRVRADYAADIEEYLLAADPETIEREHPSLYEKILKHASNKKSPVPTLSRGVGQKKQSSSAPKAKTWDEWMKDI